MKIFDCFTFFNELDLLDLRLNYLDDIVDFFVIVEADKTHSGVPKEFLFEKNRAKFSKFSSKIIYLKKHLETEGLDFRKKTQSDVEQELKTGKVIDGYWILEHAQRDHIIHGLETASIDDVVMISDIDEIPKKEAILKYLKFFYPISVTFNQAVHCYYLNCALLKEDWYGSVITSMRYVHNVQEIRDTRWNNICFKNAGWHFSYLGGYVEVKKKLLSFCHSEYSHDEYTDENMLREKIENGEDILDKGRKFVFVDITNMKTSYPNYLIDNLDKYSKHIKVVNKL